MSDDKKKPTDRERVRRALLKKALGYTVEEAVEEYASDGEELRLVKRKVSTRHLPPELTAAKEILAGREGGAAELSDEELLAACRLLFCEVFGGEEGPESAPKGGFPVRAGQALPVQAEKGRAAGKMRPGNPDDPEEAEASEARGAKAKAGKRTGPGSGAEAGRGTSPEPKAGREKIRPEAKAETDDTSDSASRAAAGQASGPEPRAKAGKGTIPEPNGGRDKKISPDPKAEAGVGRMEVPWEQEDER